MKNYLLLSVLSLCISDLLAQNYVYDASTNIPIASVHIFYGQNRGLISNEDGFFEATDISQSTDTLYFSHISYKGKKIIKNILKVNDTIFLENSFVNLKEVVINTINTKELIIKVLNKIDDNYLNVPHNSFGFFRQTLQEDSKGIEMIEVDFISYIKNRDTPYTTKINNSRRTKNYSSIQFKSTGGVYSVIEEGDFIKKNAYFLNLNNTDNYTYTLNSIIENSNLKIYVVSFTPKDVNDLKFIRKGTLYIDSKSLAIMEIKYSFDEDKIKRIKKISKLKLRKNKIQLELLSVEVIIRYKKIHNNKWVLSSIHAKNNKLGHFKNLKHSYTMTANLIINKVNITTVIPVKTNYNLTKDFNKATRRFENLKDWKNNYKFSLSKNEKIILNDIHEKNK